MGNILFDLGFITRNFPERVGTVEMLCIYKISNGIIHKVSLAPVEKRIHKTPAGNAWAGFRSCAVTALLKNKATFK